MSEPVNADPAELAKFSELAHRWWDPDGEFRPLHQINPLRLDWIDGLGELSGKRVLDVGCGGGILTDAMARKGADVLGIDLASKSLCVAQLHALDAGTKNVQYRELSAEPLAQEQPASFDAVTCMEMLERGSPMIHRRSVPGSTLAAGQRHAGGVDAQGLARAFARPGRRGQATGALTKPPWHRPLAHTLRRHAPAIGPVSISL